MEETKKKGSGTTDLTVGRPLTRILQFALPLVLGTLFQQLYSFVDTIIVGRCIGMILEVLLSLSLSTYAGEGGIRFVGIAIGLLCFWLLQKKKMSVPKVIGIAAALGVVGFGVL